MYWRTKHAACIGGLNTRHVLED